MTENDLRLLEYNPLWLEYGVLTFDLLQTQVKEFNTGEDDNTEHYRYAAFKNYLQTQSFLSDDILSKLFDIIKIDPDITMANSMALDLLKTKTLKEPHFKMVSDRLKELFGNDMQKYIDREIVWRQKQQ